MEEDNLHVTEDRVQSLVRGMVGELFVPDNRPKQDQQFGATEDDHEINNRFCLPRTRAEQQCHSCQLPTAVDAVKQCKWSCYYFINFVYEFKFKYKHPSTTK